MTYEYDGFVYSDAETMHNSIVEQWVGTEDYYLSVHVLDETIEEIADQAIEAWELGAPRLYKGFSRDELIKAFSRFQKPVFNKRNIGESSNWQDSGL